MLATETLLRCAAFCNRLGRSFDGTVPVACVIWRHLYENSLTCLAGSAVLCTPDFRGTFSVTRAMTASDTGVKCAKKGSPKEVRAVSKRYLALATAVGSSCGVGITT